MRLTMLSINAMIYNLCSKLECSLGKCSTLPPFLFLTINIPQHVLDQAAIVQFNRREGPVAPSTSVHVKCIGVVGLLKGVDSKLPPRAGGVNVFSRGACCWQVVLVSPLTGGDI